MYLIRGMLVAQVALCHLFEINKNKIRNSLSDNGKVNGTNVLKYLEID